jgi:hypothetical protein
MNIETWKLDVAKQFGLRNVDTLAEACQDTGVWFAPACTLLEKESMGRNGYGHDVGGALSGFPRLVTEDNFAVFEWMVFHEGMPSNGVGPTQITYKGFFTDMSLKGLAPWKVYDNISYGLGILWTLFQQYGNWREAATHYNGSPDYGDDFVLKLDAWRQRFADADPTK